ncbi:MAG: SufB/SufD family protein, partial [Candidatus Limnocylindrales bacterium]
SGVGPATVVAASTPAKPAASARQAPTDLTLSFVNEATVREVAALRGDPDWLLADRLAGLRAFEALPIETNQLYTTYVDLRNAHLAGVRPVQVRGGKAVSAGPKTDQRLLPVGAAAYAELDEAGVRVLVVSPEAGAAGLTIETLAGLQARDPERLRRLLVGGCTLPENDKLGQMNRALWSGGLFLDLPDGVRLEKPVVIRWSVGTPGAALLSRTVISVGEDAEVSILEEQVASDAAATDSVEQGFFAGTTEIHLGAGSILSFAGLQDLPFHEVAFQHRSAVVGRGATLRWALAQLGSRVVRSRIDNRLEGDGSTVEQAEIVFGSADQVFDLTSYTRHVGRDTTGNLLSKGALTDRSRAYMKGLATIETSAHGTDSYLGEFAMLLSKQARSVAIPSLEIDQPDCRRVAHASSVGPIDESQLFYLESRGLEREEARKFIVLGYLEPVVARVPLEAARESLRNLLEARWAAQTGSRPAAAVA